MPKPNMYVQALLGEFSPWAFDEERAPTYKGQWREEFGLSHEDPVDLEIGTGNGFHFAWRAEGEPKRGLVGIELKYKPLIQSIRRARKNASTNARMLRFNARLLNELFEAGELNHIFIHHPDPWLRKSQNKHRLIQPEFLRLMHSLQRPGSFVEFKTDSEEYFDWALPMFEESPYRVEGHTRDLHNSAYADGNFVTQFERLFLQKGQPIYLAKLWK